MVKTLAKNWRIVDDFPSRWWVGGCIFLVRARGPGFEGQAGAAGPRAKARPGLARAPKNAATNPSIRGDFSQHWEIFLNIEKNNADYALKLSIKGILRLTRYCQRWGFSFASCLYLWNVSSRKNPIKETPIQDTPQELYERWKTSKATLL